MQSSLTRNPLEPVLYFSTGWREAPHRRRPSRQPYLSFLVQGLHSVGCGHAPGRPGSNKLQLVACGQGFTPSWRGRLQWTLYVIGFQGCISCFVQCLIANADRPVLPMVQKGRGHQSRLINGGPWQQINQVPTLRCLWRNGVSDELIMHRGGRVTM